MTQSRDQPGRGEVQGSFDPQHCELERDPAKVRLYAQMLEDALGHQAQVVAVLEIGSYAKGEAVPSSDIDTRVFVTSPAAYLFNVFGGLDQPRYEGFVEECGALPRRDYGWSEFNDPLCVELSKRLSCNVEFGFVDLRYAGFELDHLDRFFSVEHAMLFQSNILYDPLGILGHWRGKLYGRIFEPLVSAYRERYLDQPYRRIYDGLGPNPWDNYKLEKSGQIIWVQRALRCLRNAVAAKVYAATGTFLYKKADVLCFYRRHLPDDLAFVRQVYGWKTDPQVRAEMVKGFQRDRDEYYALFRSCMPQLEAVVAQVKALDPGSLKLDG